MNSGKSFKQGQQKIQSFSRICLKNLAFREKILKQYILMWTQNMKAIRTDKFFTLAHSSLNPEFFIEYTVADVEKCKNELLHKAIKDSVQKVQVLTTAANVK